MKIAVIGTGNVGGALSQQLIKAGHTVLMGAKFPLSEKSIRLATMIGEERFAAVEDAVKQSEVIITNSFSCYQGNYTIGCSCKMF